MFDFIEKSRVKYNESMSKHTTYHVGGKADVFIEAKNTELVDIISECHKFCKDFCIIGNGSNLLVSDNGYDGVIIKLIDKKLAIKDNFIEVSAGFWLISLSKILAEKGYTGLEWAALIPATIGGAIAMNAGAFDSNMSNIVSKVYFLDKKIVRGYNKSKCMFGYRKSIFQRNDFIILSAELELKKGQVAEIKSKIDNYNKIRRDKFPLGYTCGSVFKNGENYKAAELIDKCGLKELRVGGAVVSKKHANFIINEEGTSKDIYLLIKKIKEIVFRKTNIMLFEELQYLGEF